MATYSELYDQLKSPEFKTAYDKIASKSGSSIYDLFGYGDPPPSDPQPPGVDMGGPEGYSTLQEDPLSGGVYTKNVLRDMTDNELYRAALEKGINPQGDEITEGPLTGTVGYDYDKLRGINKIAVGPETGEAWDWRDDPEETLLGTPTGASYPSRFGFPGLIKMGYNLLSMNPYTKALNFFRTKQDEPYTTIEWSAPEVAEVITGDGSQGDGSEKKKRTALTNQQIEALRKTEKEKGQSAPTGTEGRNPWGRMDSAQGGLMSLAHGGRPGFQDGTPSLGDWLSTPFLSEGESTFDKMKKAGSDLIKAKNLGQYQDISSSYTQPVTYEDSPVFQAGLENWDATGLGSLSSKIINKIVPSTLAMASPFDSGFLKGGLNVPPKEDVIAEYSQWNEPEMAQALGEQAWANAFGHEVSHLGWQYKPDREEWETESRAPGIGKDKGEEQWNYMHDLMYGPRYDEETFGRPGEDYLTTKGLINKGDLSYTPEAFDLIAKSRLIPEHKRAIGFGINPFEDTSRGYYRSPYQKSIAKYGTQEGPPGTKGGSTTKTNLANFAAQAKALEKAKDPRGGGAQAGGIGSTGHGRGGHHFSSGGRPGFKEGTGFSRAMEIAQDKLKTRALEILPWSVGIPFNELSTKHQQEVIDSFSPGELLGKAQGGTVQRYFGTGGIANLQNHAL